MQSRPYTLPAYLFSLFIIFSLVRFVNGNLLWVKQGPQSLDTVHYWCMTWRNNYNK